MRIENERLYNDAEMYVIRSIAHNGATFIQMLQTVSYLCNMFLGGLKLLPDPLIAQ